MHQNRWCGFQFTTSEVVKAVRLVGRINIRGAKDSQSVSLMLMLMLLLLLLFSAAEQRPHKAWGESPRCFHPERKKAAERRPQLTTFRGRRSAASIACCLVFLGLSPQALCGRCSAAGKAQHKSYGVPKILNGVDEHSRCKRRTCFFFVATLCSIHSMISSNNSIQIVVHTSVMLALLLTCTAVADPPSVDAYESAGLTGG